MSFEPMTLGLYASFLGAFFGWMMALLSIFLVLLILVQRGRGGGLTGALGGPGGQSAFGSKAGDLFTRITFIVAGVWILFCALAMFSLGDARNNFVEDEPIPAMSGTGGESESSSSSTSSSGAADGGVDIPGLGGLDALNSELLGGSNASGAEGTDSDGTDPDGAGPDGTTTPETSDGSESETPAEGAGTPAENTEGEADAGEETDTSSDASASSGDSSN